MPGTKTPLNRLWSTQMLSSIWWAESGRRGIFAWKKALVFTWSWFVLISSLWGWLFKVFPPLSVKELSLRGCVCYHPTADCQGSQRSRHHKVRPHVAPQRWHPQPIQIPEEQGQEQLLYRLDLFLSKSNYVLNGFVEILSKFWSIYITVHN